ncbi:MAG TPA: MBL fold metallo-hydrolase [Herpetosiphonaceae bacterium]
MAEVIYLGHSCVRLRGRDGIVLIDPFDRSVGLDIGKPTAHIVAVSHQAPDHNNVAAVKPMKEQLFVADGPGEYEVSNILLRGVHTQHAGGEEKAKSRNTVYVVHLDDVVFCHLGDLGHKLSAGQLDEIGTVDVLFVPVGDGSWALAASELSEVISEIEPKLVIPLYGAAAAQQSFEPSHLEPLETFAHHMALKEWNAVDKLTVSPATLPRDDEETQIAILRATAVAA